jgi:hypothetical protein
MKTWNVVNDDGRVLKSGIKSEQDAATWREILESDLEIICYIVEVPEVRYVVIAEGMDGKTGIAGTYANKQEADELAGFTCGEVVAM